MAYLCSSILQPGQRMGRPCLPLSDMLFGAAYKVYVGVSARRFTCDLKEAYASRLISNTPRFNSVDRYIANPELFQS